MDSLRSITVVRVTILGGVKDKLKGRAITTGQTILTKEGLTDIKTNTEIDPTATINGGAFAINILLSKIYLYL